MSLVSLVSLKSFPSAEPLWPFCATFRPAMRLAWFSPLPPQRSGIADYSAELLPHLAKHLDLELFVDEGVKVDPAIRARFPVHGDRAFPEMRGRFDAVL